MQAWRTGGGARSWGDGKGVAGGWDRLSRLLSEAKAPLPVRLRVAPRRLESARRGGAARGKQPERRARARAERGARRADLEVVLAVRQRLSSLLSLSR